MSATLPLTPDGNWFEIRRPRRDSAPHPALYLDRDGVLIEDRGYVGKAAEVRLIDGAASLLQAVARRGWLAIIVTNQSGIARGYYGWNEFVAVQAEMYRQLGAAASGIDAVLACPFHPEHPWRKPAPGMLLAAADKLSVDLGRSWIVGDRDKDIEAGRAAGLAGGLLLSPDGQRSPATKNGYRSLTVRSLGEAESILAAAG